LGIRDADKVLHNLLPFEGKKVPCRGMANTETLLWHLSFLLGLFAHVCVCIHTNLRPHEYPPLLHVQAPEPAGTWGRGTSSQPL
jgi:hypothetical protein